MKLYQVILPTLAAFTITAALPTSAQTTTETKVSRDTDVKDGVATEKVKVGHKTAKQKTVKETSTSSNGDMTTKVKATHN